MNCIRVINIAEYIPAMKYNTAKFQPIVFGTHVSSAHKHKGVSIPFWLPLRSDFHLGQSPAIFLGKASNWYAICDGVNKPKRAHRGRRKGCGPLAPLQPLKPQRWEAGKWDHPLRKHHTPSFTRGCGGGPKTNLARKQTHPQCPPTRSGRSWNPTRDTRNFSRVESAEWMLR